MEYSQLYPEARELIHRFLNTNNIGLHRWDSEYTRGLARGAPKGLYTAPPDGREIQSISSRNYRVYSLEAPMMRIML